MIMDFSSSCSQFQVLREVLSSLTKQFSLYRPYDDSKQGKQGKTCHDSDSPGLAGICPLLAAAMDSTALPWPIISDLPPAALTGPNFVSTTLNKGFKFF